MIVDMKQMRQASRWGEIPSRVRWTYFKDRFFKSLKAEGIAQKTIWHYELAFERLEEVLCPTYLSDITPERLDYARTYWRYKKWAKEVHLRFIKAAMHRAEDWKLVGLQNWRIVKALPPNHRQNYFTPEQVALAIEMSPEPWALAIRLMAQAGLRRGEVCHLEWTDCDLNNGIIYLRKKADWQPKTKRQMLKEAYLPMKDELWAHLKKTKQTGLFVLGGNDPMRDHVFYAEIKKCLRKLGLVGSPHTFRHSFGTHLSEYGREDIKKVKDLMRHSHLSTTEIYIHKNPETMRHTI